MTQDRAGRRLDVELGEHAEVDDLGDPAAEARSVLGRLGCRRVDANALGSNRHAHRLAGADVRAGGDDDTLAFPVATHGEVPDELGHDQVEGVQRADEVGHERRLRVIVDLARTPVCSTRPAFMTAIRSDIASASSWSCVT